LIRATRDNLERIIIKDSKYIFNKNLSKYSKKVNTVVIINEKYMFVISSPSEGVHVTKKMQ